MIRRDPYNEFRHSDAIEYAKAFEAIANHQAGTTAESRIVDGRKRMDELNFRMQHLEARDGKTPSYLLAAYRGYEHAIVFLKNHKLIEIVKVNDEMATVTA